MGSANPYHLPKAPPPFLGAGGGQEDEVKVVQTGEEGEPCLLLQMTRSGIKRPWAHISRQAAEQRALRTLGGPLESELFPKFGGSMGRGLEGMKGALLNCNWPLPPKRLPWDNQRASD